MNAINRVFHKMEQSNVQRSTFALCTFLLKPLFFLMSPERAHYVAMDLLSVAARIPGLRWWMMKMVGKRNQGKAKSVAGLTFPNTVGLAAGFDKDARWLSELQMLGFGFVEVGTVTPRAQVGNPRPRLFRLIRDQAILNRMGFNNGGLEAMVKRLEQRPAGLVVGGNIGKNKDTPNDQATEDYLLCIDALHAHVDYFVVNVSSPNTPGLRELQEKEPLSQLLRAVVERNNQHAGRRPVFLKIAPDLTNGQIDDIVDIVLKENVDGIVATNTTISREGLRSSEDEITLFGGWWNQRSSSSISFDRCGTLSFREGWGSDSNHWGWRHRWG